MWTVLARAARLGRDATLAVLSLSVAFGLVTAAWATQQWSIARTIPVNQADRLVKVYRRSARSPSGIATLQAKHYDALERRASSLGSVARQRRLDVVVSPQKPGGARDVAALEVSPSYFTVLATTFVAGRPVGAADLAAVEGTTPCVVSQRLARYLFGDNAINGVFAASADGMTWQQHLVVGVVPDELSDALDGTSMWHVSETSRTEDGEPSDVFVDVIARLASQVSLERAQSDIEAVLASAGTDGESLHAVMVPLPDDVVPVPARRAAKSALIATVGLLCLAVVNALGLLAALRMSRRHEASIKRSLGQSPWQALAETSVGVVWVVALSAAIGWCVALAALAGLRATLGSAGTSWPMSLDWGCAQFLICVSAGVAVIAIAGGGGLALPANARTGAGVGRPPVSMAQYMIVTAQSACAVCAAVAATGTLMQAAHLRAVDTGIRRAGVTSIKFEFGQAPGKQVTQSSIAVAIQNVKTKLIASGEARECAVASAVVLDGALSRVRVERPGESGARDPSEWPTQIWASKEFFSTIGAEFIEGGVVPLGVPSTSVVVNRAFAARLGSGHITGSRLDVIRGRQRLSVTVAGVVADIRHESLRGEVRPTIYFPVDNVTINPVQIVCARGVGRASLTAALRTAVAEDVFGAKITDAASIEEIIEKRTELYRYTSILLVFIALLEVAVGLSGALCVVLAVVMRRRRELLIMSALGAGTSQLAKTASGRVVAHSVSGGLVGAALSVAVAWRLAAGAEMGQREMLLGGIVTTAGVVAVIALCASVLGAARSKSDLAGALRCE